MGDCALCHRPTRTKAVPGEWTVCRACRHWRRYWDSLTPAQQRAEQAAMDAYAQESDC